MCEGLAIGNVAIAAGTVGQSCVPAEVDVAGLGGGRHTGWFDPATSWLGMMRMSRVDYGESGVIAKFMISRRELVYVPGDGIGAGCMLQRS